MAGQDVNTLKISKRNSSSVISCAERRMRQPQRCKLAVWRPLKQKQKQVPVSGQYVNCLKYPLFWVSATCTDTGRIALLVTAIAEALNVDTKRPSCCGHCTHIYGTKSYDRRIFAVAFGLYTHYVAPLPPVAGAPRLVKLITQDVEGLTGGKFRSWNWLWSRRAKRHRSAHNEERAALGLPALTKINTFTQYKIDLSIITIFSCLA